MQDVPVDQAASAFAFAFAFAGEDLAVPVQLLDRDQGLEAPASAGDRVLLAVGLGLGGRRYGLVGFLKVRGPALRGELGDPLMGQAQEVGMAATRLRRL